MRIGSTLSKSDRYDLPTNKYGIRGIDHIALTSRDPDSAARFYKEALGAVEFHRAGFEQGDDHRGGMKNVLLLVGDVIVECAEQDDGKSYPDRMTRNFMPLWGFAAGTAADVDRIVERLKEMGIPYNGPRSHSTSRHISVFFQDPDGNHLEVCTWDDYPQERASVMTGAYGGVDWAALAFEWPARK